MTGARMLLLAVLAAAALATSVLSATRLMESMAVPEASPGPAAQPSATPGARPQRRHRRTQRERPRPWDRRAGGEAGADKPQWQPLGISLPALIAVEVAAGTLALGVLGSALVLGRVRARRQREYALYELHLSPHDEAKPQDLEDMVEAIANTVRVFPAERARTGQPFVALELHHGAGATGAMEWSIGVRCEPRLAVALDAALSAAYPDVRLGHVLGEAPRSRAGTLRAPGYVLRFRKERSFIYPLVASGDELSSPPLEAVAQAQVAAGAPSVVRFQLTPAPGFFEGVARALYRRHENKLVRAERWGLPEGGLTSTLNRAEMANAERTQNRSLFWLELAVAADAHETCKQLAAAVQARRGENRLRRRWMIVRRELYRRRFPDATPPLLPSPRALVSAAEVAHLLELPSARMKGVPVRRIAIPRIPMPPEILRAHTLEPVATPPVIAAHDALPDRG
jgi:hypothetical protein